MHPFTALEFSADLNVEVCPGNAARAQWTAYVSSCLRLCHFDIRTVKYVRYELFILLWPLIHLSLLHQVIVLQAYRVSMVLLLLTRENWKKYTWESNVHSKNEERYLVVPVLKCQKANIRMQVMTHKLSCTVHLNKTLFHFDRGSRVFKGSPECIARTHKWPKMTSSSHPDQIPV